MPMDPNHRQPRAQRRRLLRALPQHDVGGDARGGGRRRRGCAVVRHQRPRRPADEGHPLRAWVPLPRAVEHVALLLRRLRPHSPGRPGPQQPRRAPARVARPGLVRCESLPHSLGHRQLSLPPASREHRTPRERLGGLLHRGGGGGVCHQRPRVHPCALRCSVRAGRGAAVRADRGGDVCKGRQGLGAAAQEARRGCVRRRAQS
mmetsp:Transcript_20115/g.27944  ORF Transcript_20115/g.27944 Transcript_20115/m.27944 type:complete len:204 (-) Transcript_20115:595-1206(-)